MLYLICLFYSLTLKILNLKYFFLQILHLYILEIINIPFWPIITSGFLNGLTPIERNNRPLNTAGYTDGATLTGQPVRSAIPCA